LGCAHYEVQLSQEMKYLLQKIIVIKGTICQSSKNNVFIQNCVIKKRLSIAGVIVAAQNIIGLEKIFNVMVSCYGNKIKVSYPATDT